MNHPKIHKSSKIRKCDKSHENPQKYQKCDKSYITCIISKCDIFINQLKTSLKTIFGVVIPLVVVLGFLLKKGLHTQIFKELVFHQKLIQSHTVWV